MERNTGNTTVPLPAPPGTTGAEIPPLRGGEHLSRQEFERRYHAMPHVTHAELIEGVVHMPSPLHYTSHSQPHGLILCWIGVYGAATPGTNFGDNASVRLKTSTELQPDVLLRLETSAGGSSSISEDDFIEGAPELVVEIAASSAAYDTGIKRQLYQEAGVQEYLVWEVLEHQLTWWVQHEDRYHVLAPDEQGIFASRVFPGLWLPGPALLGGDLATVLATVQQGIVSPAHTAFVARLASR